MIAQDRRVGSRRVFARPLKIQTFQWNDGPNDQKTVANVALVRVARVERDLRMASYHS